MNKNIISLLILLLPLHAMAEAETDSIGAARNSVFDPPQEEQVFFYHKDHLGSTLCITDRNGQIVERSEYIPYGEVFIDNLASDAEYETPYKFTGKEYDDETGLYYFGARYLHPKYATWLSVDPLATKYPNASPYAYCHDNPIKFIDPDGMDDYYSHNGEFLFRDMNETDKIFVVDNCRFFTNKDGQKKAVITNKTAIADAGLNADQWSNILTDIFSRYGGDVKDLEGGKIQVGIMKSQINNIVDYGFLQYTKDCAEVYGSFDTSTGKTTNSNATYINKNGKASITSFLYPTDESKDIYSTISNIAHLLKVHEYYYHHKKGWEDGRALDMELMRHPLWKKTTPSYKKHVMERINKK